MPNPSSYPPSNPLSPFLDLDRGRARFSVRPAPPAELDEVAGLLAGAAEVDITPPPGMPKAGYSANAHDGSGFRTRLRARVLHLRSGRTSLALVQCDLLGGSSVLQHLVADAVAVDTDVPLAGLFIGATHTHAGPGQFLGTDFYNRFASNRSGFDPAFTDFLVRRISAGVREAVASRRPARLAVGSTDVWGLTRNRSQAPHVRNSSVTDKRTEPQRKYVSINPQLHLIRVDAQSPSGEAHEPLAATVVFSVHGTGVSMRAYEYNADLWAYLVGELRHRIELSTGHRPVVGAIEGTHADVAPAIRPGRAGHVEAARVGRSIGACAAELYAELGDQLTGSGTAVPLAVGLREIDLDRESSAGGVTLPRRPAVGASLVAGAHENLTPVIHRVPPFKPGSPKRWGTDNAQGAKWTLGSRWLQPLILPLRTFPRILPVQVLRIGDTMLCGLPFEITVESGRRIEAAVRDATDRTVHRVIISSVANEYSGYVATAEEYALQHYEGGHTLYGPDTLAFLSAQAGRLAADTLRSGVVTDTSTERSWDLKIHRYLPRPDHHEAPTRVALSTPRFSDPTADEDGSWSFEWCDAGPADLTWHEPMVRVDSRDEGGEWIPALTRDGRRVDDQGWELDVAYGGHEHGSNAHGEGGHLGHRYRVRWFDPTFRAGRRHRFVVLANGDRPELLSEPFD